MISEAELRRLAGQWRVDPMVVDLDYALGCFLGALFGREQKPPLRFKGGTCLRKCYYGDYRFSEDLDFTATVRMTRRMIEGLLHEVTRAAAERWELDLLAKPLRVETVTDDYGKESYQGRLYYRGPLRRGGDPRAVRMDVTTEEVLAFPAGERRVIHPYSDSSVLGQVTVPCYDLLETVAEKIRALAGQRQYAIARDLYDLSQLALRCDVDVARLAEALPAKMLAKGMPPSPIDMGRLGQRRDAFRSDWERHLLHLLAAEAQEAFDMAWERAIGFLERVNTQLRFLLGAK